jgi:hypothetical protein
MNTMASKTSSNSTKLAKRVAANRVAAETAKTRKAASKSQSRGRVAKPALLAGGNPQIAKADGDAPVQAYIAAMPGWKRDVGSHLPARPRSRTRATSISMRTTSSTKCSSPLG